MYKAPQELRTYFLTFVTAGRRRIFQVERNGILLLQILQTNRQKARFDLHAFVIMPDHVHLILTPTPEVSLEKAVQFIKGGFSFQITSTLEVWERGYNESQIRAAEKFDACREYIEQNPVRARLAHVRPFVRSFTEARRPLPRVVRSGRPRLKACPVPMRKPLRTLTPSLVTE